MCQTDDVSAAQVSVTRRAVLTGTIAAAGAGYAGLATASAAEAAPATGRADGRARRLFGRPPVPAPLVVTGGVLLDPADGRVTEDAVVVVAEGEVLAAGTRDDTADARDEVAGVAHEIDVRGRWLLPGLVEAHVHSNAIADAATAMRLGATTLRSASSLFYQDVGIQALARWAPGSVPRMLPAGVFVTPFLGDTILGDPDLAPLATQRDGIRSPDALRYLTQVNLDRGAEVIKTRVNERAGLPEQDPLVQVYDFEQVRAIVDQARRRKAGVLCHAYSEQAIDDAVRAGIASLEHGVFVAERTLDLMRSRGTFFTPTITAIAGLAESPNPILAERGRTFLPVLRQAVRAAHEMGVPVVAGTDSFGAAVAPIGGEIAHIHDAGLPALDAIRAATTSSARLLGLDGTVGRLASGYAADLIAVDGSPLDDITALQRVALVVSGGAVAHNAIPA